MGATRQGVFGRPRRTADRLREDAASNAKRLPPLRGDLASGRDQRLRAAPRERALDGKSSNFTAGVRYCFYAKQRNR